MLGPCRLTPALLICLGFLGACAIPPTTTRQSLDSSPSISGLPASPPQAPSAVGVVNLQALPQTIGLEHQDRVRRFDRLSHLNGMQPPQIDQLQLSPGLVPGFNYPIPVVRVIFDEKVFFDFNKDTIRPEAEKILDIISQNMQHDVPDADLLVLGHTDAIGSDAYNVDLSRRRARTVMQSLIQRGVSSAHLATVAIGKNQPIAPNDTDEGRARNRRVEFMISASQMANLQLVAHRRIDPAKLKVRQEDTTSAVSRFPARVQVLTPRDLQITPKQVAQPSTVTPPISTPQAVLPTQIELRTPTTPPPFKVNTPMEVQQASLDQEFQL